MALLPAQEAILARHGIRLPSPPPTIHDALAAVPELRTVRMKLFDPRFFDVGYRIRTTPYPDRPGFFVFGYFVVDRELVRVRAARGQIKQDFLAWDRPSNRVCYYTGDHGPRRGLKRHIRHFCSDLGLTDPQYGCTPVRSGRASEPQDHYYTDEHDPHLPQEPVNQELFAFAMSHVRAELSRAKA